MATQLTEAVQIDKHIDDSEFENFNGQLARRPVPKQEHAEIQLLVTKFTGSYRETNRGQGFAGVVHF